MNTKALLVWALFAGLLASSQAHAQLSYGARTIGFETDCDGNDNQSGYTAPLIIGGYKAVDDAFFEACGISAITSGGGSGNQQLHRPASQILPGSLAGMDGDVALSGTFILEDGSFSQGALTIRFNPPVNELSFKILSLDNPNGLKISLYEAGGASITTPQPTVSNSMATFSYTSPGPSYTPVGRVVVSYTPSSFIDGWFVDTVAFNAWHCGDGEPEPNEQCDDGNNVACDGCNNSCNNSTDGCLHNGACVPAGPVAGTFGCASCTIPTPRPADTEISTDSESIVTLCDSGSFCKVDEHCSGTGTCVGEPRDCADAASCTVDACDEVQDQCTHIIQGGACLIDGVCYTSGEANVDDPCERCDRNAPTVWSLKPAGARCGDPSCSNGVLTPYPQCSASGSCDAQAPVSCDGSVCADSVSCVGACTNDGGCLPETHCDQGVCVPDLPPGEPCQRSSQCDSNFCVDGVCCGDLCNGPCVSCALPGKVGMCSPHESGTDPENDCPDAQFCGGNGKCVGENRPDGSACDSAAQCASGFCADGVCCNAACDRSCESCDLPDASGTCTPYEAGTDPEMECPKAQLCAAPGVCAPENRPDGSPCDDDAYCASGLCEDGVCAPVNRPNGSECAEDAYCASGHCADGVCCDLACDGTCEACNMPDQLGACVPFAAGSDPANECSGEAVCSGERSCIRYETRGNGLCSVTVGGRGSFASLMGLLALSALLAARRRRAG